MEYRASPAVNLNLGGGTICAFKGRAGVAIFDVAATVVRDGGPSQAIVQTPLLRARPRSLSRRRREGQIIPDPELTWTWMEYRQVETKTPHDQPERTEIWRLPSLLIGGSEQ